MFRKRIPKFLHSRANLFADSHVGVDRFLLALDSLATQGLFGLRNPEFVGCQFGPAHAVEKIILRVNLLKSLDGFCPQSTIESAIACIVKHAEHLAANSRHLGGSAQLAIRVLHSIANDETALRFGQGLLLFLDRKSTRLNS